MVVQWHLVVGDFKTRKGLAWTAFWKLERLWRCPCISISTKIKLNLNLHQDQVKSAVLFLRTTLTRTIVLYLMKIKLFNTTCVTVLLYSCESWVLSKAMESGINAFGTSCYRNMFNIKRIDRVSSATIYDLTQTVPLVKNVRTRQLRFLGHVRRMPDAEPCKEYVYSITWEEETRKAANRVSQLHSTPIGRHRQHDWPRQAV